MVASAEGLYAQLQELAQNEPDFTDTAATARWLGRLHQTVVDSDGGVDIVMLKVAADGLGTVLNDQNIRRIRNVMYRAIAKVEKELPVAAQGGFIAAGDVFDALAVLASALESATKRVLIVDPYMGREALMNFALLVTEGVQIDLLGAEGRTKSDLKPSADAWVQQYGDKRPLRIRCVEKSRLHDRLLIIDDKDAWDISQSLNALAKRSPATIAKARDDQAAMKVEAYDSLFDDATSLL